MVSFTEVKAHIDAGGPLNHEIEAWIRYQKKQIPPEPEWIKMSKDPRYSYYIFIDRESEWLNFLDWVKTYIDTYGTTDGSENNIINIWIYCQKKDGHTNPDIKGEWEDFMEEYL